MLSNVAFKFNWRRYTKVLLGAAAVLANGRGLHSFPFQLNLSYSVHYITQLKS